MTFALPVACLYLPFVIGLGDAEKGRIWTILGSGILIGPVALLLYIFALRLGHRMWRSDDLVPGPGAGVIMALAVGSATTILYVIALKTAHWLSPRIAPPDNSGRAL